MRLLITLTLAVTVLLLMLPSAGSAARSGGDARSWYLALGDSLSVGFQPNRGETSLGYVDDLWRSMRPEMPGLALRKAGCPGETSASMITGKKSLCRYAGGSQLNAATAFLAANPGEVAFITIDLGANDLINRCFDDDTGLIGKQCTTELLPRLQERLTQIVDALRAAAGPDVPIVAMNYYDPFLGFWGLVPGGKALARANQQSWVLFNEGIETAYRGAGASIANVAKTFQTDDFTLVTVPGRGRIPLNVSVVCRWTWFCSPRYAGDPHPTTTGYDRIARTFERTLAPLLP